LNDGQIFEAAISSTIAFGTSTTNVLEALESDFPSKYFDHSGFVTFVGVGKIIGIPT
jgi:hypothetical protein